MNQDAMQSRRSLTPSLPPQRSYSPSPLFVSTDNLNQSPMDSSPAQHYRQPSGNLLADHQIRSPSPGPQATINQYQYPPQPHSRQNSGNNLASTGYSQPYSPQQRQQHIRQISGNVLGQGGRESYQSYSPQSSPQHGRQMSANIHSSPPPSYIASPPGLQQHQHQQSTSSNGHSNTAGRGPRSGY